MQTPDGETIAPTGKRFETFFTTIAKWKNDQIVEEYVMLDPRDIMKQVVPYLTLGSHERSAQTNAMSRSANTLNDGSLLLAAKNERSMVFATLSDQYKEQLFRAAHRITRTHEDAEDAVQDTLLRAFVHLGDFEGRSNFGTWLTSISVNSALMILRRKRASREIAIDGSNDFGLDGAAYKIAEDAPNPETRYAQTEEQGILRAAIQRLPPNLRVVVQIHLQGRSMRETAEALGISLSAAKGRLFHAKKALRRSAIGKLVQRRFAGKLCVLRPGLLGAADTRTRFHH